MVSEDWLQRRTYHHTNFWDIRWLLQQKERQGLRISLCLPTYNEEKTIGQEIVIFKAELMDRFPLLDEIAVIDSGSTDKTCQIAAEFGADVYIASEHLAEYGVYRGKGENLWKALYLLQGDILVYVDTDIANIHPRFVYGLVGPLLANPEVHYVKAFYDRPIAHSGQLRPTGGGRVTEILIRPLFSLFYPELTAILQPLSGEYAGRRSILEQIPYPVGYGVETAMLIDIYQRLGMEAFAQTDLDRRVHRNQDTVALGRMAFGVARVFFSRLRRDGKIQYDGELPTLMRQFEFADGNYRLRECTIEEIERPPMIELEAYRRKFYPETVASASEAQAPAADTA
ncbi:MAG TPA: glucosyl-3-phosphoglycerate synthase [Thermoguttaceae bacterium]|nr:glucosyl-3-phosphoglycerate synthase [Thermoguttaceae bacterium]HPP54304.1 glucosyl-3-phosphoglycerate synthase [Thermoguttaceae bacterium]